MSDSWQPHRLQHARFSCPSPSPRVCSNSCPWSWWCHPRILSSVPPFFSCLQSFPISGSFPNDSVLHIRWPKYWSFSSASVLLMNIQVLFIYFFLGLIGLTSLLSKRLSRVFSSATIQKHQFLDYMIVVFPLYRGLGNIQQFL